MGSPRDSGNGIAHATRERGRPRGTRCAPRSLARVAPGESPSAEHAALLGRSLPLRSLAVLLGNGIAHAEHAALLGRSLPLRFPAVLATSACALGGALRLRCSA